MVELEEARQNPPIQGENTVALALCMVSMQWAVLSGFSLLVLGLWLLCRCFQQVTQVQPRIVEVENCRHRQGGGDAPPGYLASTSPLFTIYSASSADSTMGNTTNS